MLVKHLLQPSVALQVNKADFRIMSAAVAVWQEAAAAAVSRFQK